MEAVISGETVLVTMVLTAVMSSISKTGHANSRAEPHQVRFQLIAFLRISEVKCLKPLFLALNSAGF
jgi:hypothetical protein